MNQRQPGFVKTRSDVVTITGNIDFRQFRSANQVRLALLAVWLVIWIMPQNCWSQLSSLPPLPWPSSRPITVSFTPDLVEIGRYRNELFMHMNDHLNFPDWQIEILRSTQTWSRHAGLQFALVPDSPRHFGTPGLSRRDPRFGDIRLGAFPQTKVLGNAVPYHWTSGTWAGDIFLDTNRTFYLHDHSSSDPLPVDEFDLYSISLHEMGNVLGLLDDEKNPNSVMFFAYVGPRLDLNQVDIEAIQELYGPPLDDLHEPKGGNDSFATAELIQLPSDIEQTRQHRIPGRIHNGSDCDIYRLDPPSFAESVWLKLKAQGQSLLVGRVVAFDHELDEIARDEAENPIDNNAIKEITGLRSEEPIFIKVEWSGYPDFDFGDYELVLDFNKACPDGSYGDGDDDGDDGEDRFIEAGDADLVDTLYALEGLIDLETDTNNSFEQALELFSPLGASTGTRFETISSIAAADDVDTYRITISPMAQQTMAIDLYPLGWEPTAFDIRVFRENGQSVRSRRRYRETGEVIVDVQSVQASATYFVRVLNRIGQQTTGNYLLVVNVPDGSELLQPVEMLQLNAADPDRFGVFTTFKTQLFQFELGMNPSGVNNLVQLHAASTPTQATQLTIYSDTGRVELVTSVQSGRKANHYVWLHAGEHYLRFTVRTLNTAPVQPAMVTLLGASVSDDEGPILIDPSGNPISGPQRPGNNPAPPPIWEFPSSLSFLIELVIPFDNPWF